MCTQTLTILWAIYDCPGGNDGTLDVLSIFSVESLYVHSGRSSGFSALEIPDIENIWCDNMQKMISRDVENVVC